MMTVPDVLNEQCVHDAPLNMAAGQQKYASLLS